MRTTHLLTVAALSAAMSVSWACKREDDPIRVYKAGKETGPQIASVPATPAATSDGHNHGNDSVGELTWTAPADWQAGPPTQFAAATFVTPNGLTVSISPLAREGGAAQPNIARWQRQIGMPESAEADLPNITTHLHIGNLEALGVDLTGPAQQRVIGTIVPAGERVYFFKLIGPADKVAAQKANFDALIKSIRPAGKAAVVAEAPKAEVPKVEAPKVEAPTVEAPKVDAPKSPAAEAPEPAAEAVKIPGVASYTLPAGWQVDATPRPMRAATIVVTKGEATAQIIVSRLGAGAFGDRLSNINRWRGHVGLTPTDNADTHAAAEVATPAGPVDVMDFVGPEGKDRKQQLVGVTKFPNAQTTWFFRFLGPAELVGGSRADFEAFLKSLKFEE